ncbi:hypothetical protein J0X15_01450 [Roseibium sp. CAU 1637]|uniref:Uncharacterized protein n=1 Tax=Roseibium limicola TaxID=2816037 RepID=A0A939EJY8_9HYPH|nr:DUF6111 family protein [Roseibium limicola]MBO0343873.1 hypothetical protein [Roseibium limicola]
MLRVILSHAALFLLPFIGYAIWLWIKNKTQTSETWRQGPMLHLALAGTVMVIVSLVFFSSFEQASKDADYRPSRLENGVFVPGGFE